MRLVQYALFGEAVGLAREWHKPAIVWAGMNSDENKALYVERPDTDALKKPSSSRPYPCSAVTLFGGLSIGALRRMIDKHPLSNSVEEHQLQQLVRAAYLALLPNPNPKRIRYKCQEEGSPGVTAASVALNPASREKVEQLRSRVTDVSECSRSFLPFTPVDVASKDSLICIQCY